MMDEREEEEEEILTIINFRTEACPMRDEVLVRGDYIRGNFVRWEGVSGFVGLAVLYVHSANSMRWILDMEWCRGVGRGGLFRASEQADVSAVEWTVPDLTDPCLARLSLSLCLSVCLAGIVFSWCGDRSRRCLATRRW